MNDWNPLEQQLSGWTPRHPSPKIERKLFPARLPVKRGTPLVPPWRWLATTTSFALLAFVLLAQMNLGPIRASASHPNPLLASLSSSNGNSGLANPPNRHSRQNAWAIVKAVGTFDWTNKPRSLSTTGSFLDGMTNSLIR